MIIEDKKTAAQIATLKCAELLNYFLQNRVITSVEPGNTPGWVLINFEAPEGRQFMTLWVGTKPFYSEYDETMVNAHDWETAIHHRAQNGSGDIHPIRKIEVPAEDVDDQGWESDCEVYPADEPYLEGL